VHAQQAHCYSCQSWEAPLRPQAPEVDTLDDGWQAIWVICVPAQQPADGCRL